MKQKPSRRDTRLACSMGCSGLARLRAKPKNPLRRRCLEYMRANRLSFSAFAGVLGLPQMTLRTWFAEDSRTTAASTLAKLAAILELTPDEALRLAGGRTAEERR